MAVLFGYLLSNLVLRTPGMVKRLFPAVSCSFRLPAFFGLVPASVARRA